MLFRSTTHTKFCCVIRGLGRDADQAEHARDVDDMALPGSTQVGKKRLGAVHHAPEVDVHEPFEVVVACTFNGGAQVDASIIDD